MSNYLKLLTKDDIEEILKEGEITLTTPFKNHNGETVNSYDRSKNFILCRGETQKNKQLELIVKFLSPLIGEAVYAPHKVLVFISDYQAWIAEIHQDEYIDENTKMTLKLKEILSRKSDKYLNDFETFWENQEDDENE